MIHSSRFKRIRARATRGGRPWRGESRPLEFIAAHPVFRTEEFEYGVGGSANAVARALQYHVSTGRLLNLRRGVYLSKRFEKFINPWLLASRLTPDALVAYEGALSYFLPRLFRPGRIALFSTQRLRGFTHNRVEYFTVAMPHALHQHPGRGAGVDGDLDVRFEHGEMFRLCSLSRAFVDCLDRVELGPGLAPLWHAFAQQRDLDLKAMIGHATRLNNRMTAARLGLFVEHHPRLESARAALSALDALRPKTAGWCDPAIHRDCQLFSRWNLMVPTALLRAMS